MTLTAPFPWFGGKRRVGALVWGHFGADIANYVEPFAGSLAVLLARPGEPRIETVNDLDCYVANFWRALRDDPELVADIADWPVNEADLHARHQWIVDQQQHGFRERMMSDPDYYDPQIAGWWVWGISQWIGSGWCRWPKARGRFDRFKPRGVHAQKTNLSTNGTGVHRQRMHLAHDGMGVHAKRPRLDRGGRGVSRQLPCLSGDGGAAGRGIHASGLARKMPKCDRGTESRIQSGIYAWMTALADRLRRVRVCCGDWKRVMGTSPTTCIGTTAVFLDPPYGIEAKRTENIYAQDSMSVAADVRAWCLEHGDHPKLRIALCGYEGEHNELENMRWKCVAWQGHGGYGNRTTRGQENGARERIWFSPHCLLEGAQPSLFEEAS